MSTEVKSQYNRGKLTFSLSVDHTKWEAWFETKVPEGDIRLLLGSLNVEPITPMHYRGDDPAIDAAVEKVKDSFMVAMREAMLLLGKLNGTEIEIGKTKHFDHLLN